MAQIDAMPAELRALVHEHGYTIVRAFLDCGVTKPKHIQHLIDTVRHGSQEIGKRVDKCQIGSGLAYKGYATVPMEPTEEMVTAGIASTAAWLELKGSQMTVNREKMRRRYRAMVLAAPKDGTSGQS